MGPSGPGEDRLSQLSTCWTLLANAHGGNADARQRAQAALIERYQGAIYRYLFACLRDADAVAEVFQEFALGVLTGAFSHADPERGRFRNYVKTSLLHLVTRHRTRQARGQLPSLAGTEPEAESPDAAALDQEFLAGWRAALLERAWKALAGSQRPGGPPYHDALKLRTESPDLTTAELTARLNGRPGTDPALTEAGLRKVLQRAREFFADFLLEEIDRSLRGGSPDDLEQEVIDLGFHAYCRGALERRRAGERPRPFRSVEEA